MSIKEQMIKKALVVIDKKLKKLDDFLESKPLSRVCEVREEAAEIMKKHKGDYKKIAELIGPLADEEKKLFKIARLQIKPGVTGRKIDEKVELRIEKAILERELIYLNQATF